MRTAHLYGAGGDGFFCMFQLMFVQRMTVVHLASGSPDLDAISCCMDLAPGHGLVVSVVAELLHCDHGTTSVIPGDVAGYHCSFLAFPSLFFLRELAGCFGTFYCSGVHKVMGYGGQLELYVDTALLSVDLES